MAAATSAPAATSELPLPLLFGNELDPARYKYSCFAADRALPDRAPAGGGAATGLRPMRRDGRLLRRANTAGHDGRQRIAFAEWWRNTHDALVVRAQALRVQHRRRDRESLRRHAHAWAAATVGARAVADVERDRLALAEREERFADELASKQAARDAAERRDIYRRGMQRGSDAADAAWASRREKDARAAQAKLQEVRTAHAAALAAAVEQARSAAHAAASAQLRQQLAAAAAKAAMAEAVATAEEAARKQLAAQRERDAATRAMKRAEELEMRAVTAWARRQQHRALASWTSAAHRQQAARTLATQALAAAAQRRVLQLACAGRDSNPSRPAQATLGRSVS